MYGLWIENGKVRLRDDLPRPRPAADEVLLEVLQAGICGTDLQLLSGYAQFTGVPGHEFVGRVVAGPDEWIGQRVVAEINIACGSCPQCQAGRRRHCERRQVLGIRDRAGALAQYLTVPVRNLHRVPASVSDAQATFVEPLAAAVHVLEQTRPQPARDRILVVGDGRLGQLVARALHAQGCERLVVVGRHERKLALLRDAGIRATDRMLDGRFDIAVDCTGRTGGIVTATNALRPLGTLVLKSTYAGQPRLPVSSWVVDELHVLGSRCGPFPPAMERLAAGAIDVEALIDARFTLEQGVEAMERAAEHDTLKVIVRIGS